MKFFPFLLTWRLLWSWSAIAQNGMVTIRVTDETDRPVQEATVSAGFETALGPGQGWGAGMPNSVRGTTDTNGICVLRGSGSGGSVAIGVPNLPGRFYGNDGYEIIFTNRARLVTSKWQPWNPVVHVTLRRIINPIALYVKEQGDIATYWVPVVSGEIAYDLVKGDWVAPNGSGSVRDLIFMLDRTLGEVTKSGYQTFEAKLSLTFSNDGDGVQEVIGPERMCSGPRIPREAPASGYASNWISTSFLRADSESSPLSRDICYYFRVRSQKDRSGNITNSLYGKIYGPIKNTVMADKWGLSFLYYLNPEPNDRNLEFDPAKNLLADPRQGRVYRP